MDAYELAHGTLAFSADKHRCQWAPENEPSEVILDVHIPVGIGNVDAKWKMDVDGLLVVRSRWQWKAPTFKKERTTWDPDIDDWAEDGKAGGADPVFKSRLPRPIRIASLGDATDREIELLEVALSPLLDQIKKLEQDRESELYSKLDSLTKSVTTLVGEHTKHIDTVGTDIGKGFQNVFPGLAVRLDVQMPQPKLKLGEALLGASSVRVADLGAETGLDQQGTGARRALFWAMVQVHNQLERAMELAEGKDGAKQKKEPKKGAKKLVAVPEASAPVEEVNADPAFPGYLLLIDEPENALHPMAARAAQKHLYQLAKDPEWQVMLTTHSPYFINPLEDHTTIIRLERPVSAQAHAITPHTYRSDAVEFHGEAKSQLQAIQNMDTSLAEIFFGSYPILAEGDTEHAAFVATFVEPNDPLAQQITVVRARGKAIIVPIMAILQHFRVPFGVLHDGDAPYKKDGTNNGMWTENQKIRDSVLACRQEGISVRHAISVPDFERFLGGGKLGKDKPLAAYERVQKDTNIKAQCAQLFTELKDGPREDLFAWDGSAATHQAGLLKATEGWATANAETNNPRYFKST